MHEASLARKLLEQVNDVQRDHPNTRLTTVEIELGPLSGVEPLLFKSAFKRLVAEEGASDIELVIHEVALEATCQSCHQQFEIHDFEFVCPLCDGASLDICQGDCVRLMSVDLLPIEHREGSIL